MNKVTFGSYYHSNSIIHRLDPRIKIIAIMLLMVGIFLIPIEAIYMFFIILGLLLIFVILSKVPFGKFLKSIKQITFLLLFSFVFQIVFNKTGTVVATYTINISIGTIAIGVLVYTIYAFIKKFVKFKMTLFFVMFILEIIIFRYALIDQSFFNYSLDIYSNGLHTGFYILIRVLLLVVLSSLLTLTTKPTDMNVALEYLLSPLELLKIKTSIFAMMMSISLRFIPTLFLETEKILKAQASRGVDFKEGKLGDKIKQIVSLLVPMFVVSFRRAEDLSNAMEVRGYIPGAKRTKLNELKIKLRDILSLVVVVLLFGLCITSLILVKVGVL